MTRSLMKKLTCRLPASIPSSPGIVQIVQSLDVEVDFLFWNDAASERLSLEKHPPNLLKLYKLLVIDVDFLL